MRTVGVVALCVGAGLISCSRSNNLLFGRVETTLGAHDVVVTDCYRTSVPPAEQFLSQGRPAWRYKPCRDADILIQDEKLTVNGESYGALNPGDSVLVDHGVVKIAGQAAKGNGAPASQ